MNKLMLMAMGMTQLQNEAGESGGGTPADEPKTALAAAGEGGATDGDGGGGEDGEPKTALADAGENGDGEGGEDKAAGENAADGEETAEDIEKAITEGENDFKGKWDSEQVKEMAPLLKELGVSKENASKLAVKLAEVQTRQIQEAELKFRQEQIARIKTADAENAKTFSKADYKQINAGIQKYSKADGPLRKLLYTTELGTDPEVLRIFHALGGSAGIKETAAPAASGAAGNPDGWAEAFEK